MNPFRIFPSTAFLILLAWSQTLVAAALVKHGYTRQTGHLTFLIADLKKPQPTADLAAISQTAPFANMVQAQTAFEALTTDRAATEDGQTLPTLSEHRPQLERRINLILNNLAEWQAPASTPALARRTKAEATPGPVTGPAVSRNPPKPPGSAPCGILDRKTRRVPAPADIQHAKSGGCVFSWEHTPHRRPPRQWSAENGRAAASSGISSAPFRVPNQDQRSVSPTVSSL